MTPTITHREGAVYLAIGDTEIQLTSVDVEATIIALRRAALDASTWRYQRHLDAEEADSKARAEAYAAQHPGAWLVPPRSGGWSWGAGHLSTEGQFVAFGSRDCALAAAPDDIWWRFAGRRILHLFDGNRHTRCRRFEDPWDARYGYREPHPKWKRCPKCEAWAAAAKDQA